MGLVHDFDTKLAYTRGVRQDTDIETIDALFPGCVSVEKTDAETDRAGVDYVITLRRGATVLVDAKTREPNVRRFWCDGVPEVALETWSVLPDPSRGIAGKPGWTLSEASGVDYILYTFDPADCRDVFLYPFQLLRLTFRKYLPAWWKAYPPKIQKSPGWKSQALFVPEPVVWAAMRDVSVIRPIGDGHEGNPPTKY